MPVIKYTTKKGLVQSTGKNLVDLGPSASVKRRADKAPEMQTLVFMYDFDALGGAASELTLTDANGNAQSIPRGFVIVDGWVEVITAVTSGGSATMVIGTAGTSNDPDGFVTTSNGAKAVLALSAIVGLDGALVTDKDGTAVVRKKIVTTDDPVTTTVATAVVTAGKWYLHLRGYHSLSVA